MSTEPGAGHAAVHIAAQSAAPGGGSSSGVGRSGDARVVLRHSIVRAVERLREAGVASPDVDARLLAEHLLGAPVLLAREIPKDFFSRYEELVAQRCQRIPLQRIMGRMWFRALELTAAPEVFIVRPETESVAQAAIDACRDAERRQDAAAQPLLVDLCTGSGAIALSVATETHACVYAVELSPAAVACAADNMQRIAPGRVTLVQGDATDSRTLAELDGRVDVVVSNPPYVPPGELEDPETQWHDPHSALFGGGEDGTAIPRAIIERAAVLLRRGGVLVMEHDSRHGQLLREAALQAGYGQATTGQDLTGRDRYLRAQR